MRVSLMCSYSHICLRLCASKSKRQVVRRNACLHRWPKTHKTSPPPRSQDRRAATKPEKRRQRSSCPLAAPVGGGQKGDADGGNNLMRSWDASI